MSAINIDDEEASIAIASIRAVFARIRATSPPPEPMTEEEAQRRRAVLKELIAETKRLGLYK